jgi:hypothetical protein
MGLSPFSSSENDEPRKATPPNPDPGNWKVKDSQQVGYWLVVKIQYPDCTNYEGNKILVYKGINIRGLRALRRIDPHFSDNKEKLAPFARFEPTGMGWQAAIQLARIYNPSDAVDSTSTVNMNSTWIITKCSHKVYSTEGCPCCWHCPKCGKHGCDNMVSYKEGDVIKQEICHYHEHE